MQMARLSERAFVGCHGGGGGAGVYVPATERSREIRLPAPLDEDERPTNNAAQWTVAIAGWRLFCAMSVRLCVVTDSEKICLNVPKIVMH